MLGRLTKLAQRSAQLRRAALRKEAGILGAVSKQVGGAAIGGALAAPTAIAKTKEYKQGFDPAYQQSMHGPAPKPPGV